MHAAERWLRLAFEWKEFCLWYRGAARRPPFLRAVTFQLYKDQCCQWMCGLVGQSTHERACTATAVNTGHLFLFVAGPEGLLLGRVCVYLWSKWDQDVAQIFLRRPSPNKNIITDQSFGCLKNISIQITHYMIFFVCVSCQVMCSNVEVLVFELSITI